MAEALLIGRADIVKFTAMNGNVDTDSFIQWIKVAQDIHIQNYLGTNLLEKLQLDVTKLVTKVPVFQLMKIEDNQLVAYNKCVETIEFHSDIELKEFFEEECKYKLCGITVAPMIPTAMYKAVGDNLVGMNPTIA